MRRLRMVMVTAAMAGATFTSAVAQDGLQPGEAFVTRFSGTTTQAGQTVIDPNGIVSGILDIRRPGVPPEGQAWPDAPHGPGVTAAEVGQVFGLAFDDANPPNIYLTATSAFGLHRTPDNAGWMAGMWGTGGGPGTVWRLDAATGYAPQIFADITFAGRANTGASLGNIAYDRWNGQLYVSDLETGVIHRLSIVDGSDLGTYDHGTQGRASFVDAETGASLSLPPVPFDPATGARIGDCAAGTFANHPSCWNFADFRRRVWGLGVRRDAATGDVRLYYSIWGSQGFGDPTWFTAGEDQRNAIWSVRIGPDGGFDITDVRREFLLPNLFTDPAQIASIGPSHPVADIAFPKDSEQSVMLLAERGGVRNLGLDAAAPFARPFESRALRYELDPQGVWRLAGRYDVGFYDRKNEGQPYLRANAAGGIDFGYGYSSGWQSDEAEADQFVWIAGEGLCSPDGPCVDPATGNPIDTAELSGVQGTPAGSVSDLVPAAALQPYPATGYATPPATAEASYMVGGSTIGDIEVYQPTEAAEVAGGAPGAYPPGAAPPAGPVWGYDPAPPPPDGWWVPPPLVIGTDLAIAKTGPAECQEGADCDYTITIRNVGLLDYVGPLAVHDTMPVGATLAAFSPGWHCHAFGPEVYCRTFGHAWLPVATSATLQLTVTLPLAVPGPTVHNCAAIDWFEMGTNDGFGDFNDISCIDTPVLERFDLGVVKTGPAGPCLDGGQCVFDIAITNHGPGDFDGVLAIRDALDGALPAGASLDSATAGWGCVLSGHQIDCQTTTTLAAAASTTLTLTVRLPSGIPAAMTDFENCAAVNWGAMASDDGEPDAHADEGCATIALDHTGFDLGISKAGPPHCDQAAVCTFTVDITNYGPDPYNFAPGPTEPTVTEDTNVGGTNANVTASTSGVPWACGPGALPSACWPTAAVPLNAGDVESLTLDILLPVMPAPVPDDFENCVTIAWNVPPDDSLAADTNDQSCITVNLTSGLDLEITKTGPSECYEGHVCEYEIEVTNHGPKTYFGELAVNDTLPTDGTVDSISGSTTWTCDSTAGTVSCHAPTGAAGLASGASETLSLGVLLPDLVAAPTVDDCASVDWALSDYTGDENAANDGPVCVTTPVLAADLAPAGGTVCKRGETCAVDVQIDNRGGRRFVGAVGLRGTLLPPVQISSVEAQTPGLECQVTGAGTYECDAAQLSLESGESAEIKLSIVIPADFPQSRIEHRKEMIWPDIRVKDEKPENDRHVSTIWIEEPVTAAPECAPGQQLDPASNTCVYPPCPPGQVRLGGLCVYPPCPQGQVRDGAQCVYPACPPGQIRDGARCVYPPCPRGQMRLGGLCVYPPCPQGQVRAGAQCVYPACPPGQIRQGARCVYPPCPRGQIRQGAQCVYPPCPQGQIRQGAQCVFPPCPRGQVRVNGRCVVPACPPGQIRQGGKCVYPACPRGQVRINGKCVLPACPPGQIRQGGKCVLPACPSGQIRQGGKCVYPPCPDGQVRRGAQCVCPGGTVWEKRRGRCMPITQQQPRIQQMNPLLRQIQPKVN